MSANAQDITKRLKNVVKNGIYITVPTTAILDIVEVKDIIKKVVVSEAAHRLLNTKAIAPTAKNVSAAEAFVRTIIVPRMHYTQQESRTGGYQIIFEVKENEGKLAERKIMEEIRRTSDLSSRAITRQITNRTEHKRPRRIPDPSPISAIYLQQTPTATLQSYGLELPSVRTKAEVISDIIASQDRTGDPIDTHFGRRSTLLASMLPAISRSRLESTVVVDAPSDTEDDSLGLSAVGTLALPSLNSPSWQQRAQAMQSAGISGRLTSATASTTQRGHSTTRALSHLELQDELEMRRLYSMVESLYDHSGPIYCIGGLSFYEIEHRFIFQKPCVFTSDIVRWTAGTVGTPIGSPFNPIRREIVYLSQEISRIRGIQARSLLLESSIRKYPLIFDDIWPEGFNDIMRLLNTTVACSSLSYIDMQPVKRFSDPEVENKVYLIQEKLQALLESLFRPKITEQLESLIGTGYLNRANPEHDRFFTLYSKCTCARIPAPCAESTEQRERSLLKLIRELRVPINLISHLLPARAAKINVPEKRPLIISLKRGTKNVSGTVRASEGLLEKLLRITKTPPAESQLLNACDSRSSSHVGESLNADSGKSLRPESRLETPSRSSNEWISCKISERLKGSEPCLNDIYRYLEGFIAVTDWTALNYGTKQSDEEILDICCKITSPLTAELSLRLSLFVKHIYFDALEETTRRPEILAGLTAAAVTKEVSIDSIMLHLLRFEGKAMTVAEASKHRCSFFAKLMDALAEVQRRHMSDETTLTLITMIEENTRRVRETVRVPNLTDPRETNRFLEYAAEELQKNSTYNVSSAMLRRLRGDYLVKHMPPPPTSLTVAGRHHKSIHFPLCLLAAKTAAIKVIEEAYPLALHMHIGRVLETDALRQIDELIDPQRIFFNGLKLLCRDGYAG